MTTWFVTRHNGAVFWAARQKLYAPDMKRVADLDPDWVQSGEIVYGTLPVNLVSKIIARGARYFHLSMNIPAELRGRDLSADEMEQIEATLEEFHAHSVSQAQSLSNAITNRPGTLDQPVVLINLCSGERMQNLLPVSEVAASHVYLLHTSFPGSVYSANDLQTAIRLLKPIRPANSSSGSSKKEIEVTLCQYDELSGEENGHSLRETALDILSKHESARIICNVTGGSKLMAQELREFATEWSLECLYCDTSEGGVRLLYPERPVWTSRVIPFSQKINLLQFLAAQGLSLLSEQKVPAKDSDQLALAEEIFKRSLTHFKDKGKPSQHIDLNNFMFMIGNSSKKGIKIELRPKESEVKNKELLPSLEHFLTVNKLVKIDLNEAGFLNCTFLPAAGMTAVETKEFLGGKWFEVVFARAMVDALNQQKHQINAHFGVSVAFANKPLNQKEGDYKDNEVDCVLLFKNRIFMLELKAGAGFLAKRARWDDKNKLSTLTSKDENAATYKGLALLDQIGGAMARYSFIANSDNRAVELASHNPRFKNYQLGLEVVDEKARSHGVESLSSWILENILSKLN